MDALKLNDSASEILQKFVVFFYEKLKLLFPFFISSLYRHRSGTVCYDRHSSMAIIFEFL